MLATRIRGLETGIRKSWIGRHCRRCRRSLLGDDAFQDASRLDTAGVDVQVQQVSPRVREQVSLLRFEHLQILAEYLSLAVADRRGKRLVLRVEVARHPPEVPDRGLGLGRDEVDHDAGYLELGFGVVASLSGMGDSHFDHHVTWRREAADLPA